jgi:hypothetical protein
MPRYTTSVRDTPPPDTAQIAPSHRRMRENEVGLGVDIILRRR